MIGRWGRTPTFQDYSLEALGALIGYILWWKILIGAALLQSSQRRLVPALEYVKTIYYGGIVVGLTIPSPRWVEKIDCFIDCSLFCSN